MGQTLSEPITTKHTSVTANSLFRVAASCMQGWRINMEDAHTCLLSLPGDPPSAYFAVFDGHGGSAIAQHASHQLHKKIVSSPHYAVGNIDLALKQAFLQLDNDMIKDPHLGNEVSGTTAVSVLIKGGKIYCSNVGDSRAIASVDGSVQQLSFDHKPGNEIEQRRIIAAGGWVEFNRVNGNLALSRALGDFSFKRNDRKSAEEQIVTANPDVIKKEVSSSHEFIVVACDGIWDVMSNSEVIQFIRSRIAQRQEPSVICEALLNACLAPDAQMGGLGCDNMTVVLICFLNNQPYDNLATRCSKPARIMSGSAQAQHSASTSSYASNLPRQSDLSTVGPNTDSRFNTPQATRGPLSYQSQPVMRPNVLGQYPNPRHHSNTNQNPTNSGSYNQYTRNFR